VDEVGELDWILDEEYRSVVADHIVIALLGVVLDGKSAGVTVAIVGTALTCDGRKAEEDGGLLSNLVQKLGLAKMGDVVSHNTFTVSSGTLGVDNTFGDTLASEVSQFVDQVEVSEDDGALRTSSHRVLIVVHRTAMGCSNGLH